MTGMGILFVPTDGFVEDHGWRVSIVFADESGHYPTGNWPYDGSPGTKCPWFVPGPSYKEAQTQIDIMNTKRGYNPKEAALVIAESMARRGA